MKSPARCSFTYEVSWMDGLFGLVIISSRLLITGWNCGCLFGFFIGRLLAWLTGGLGWPIDYLNI